MFQDKKFKNNCQREIKLQGKSKKLRRLSHEWIKESIKTNYSYHFEWLGIPIIQYPQDIMAVQQLIWEVKPDLIIETGIARGGSLIFNASMLKLVSFCGGEKKFKVIGIDIDIRKKNKNAIISHPMNRHIQMIEGSSVHEKVLSKLEKKIKNSKKIMVFLDSNHTHDHVLNELRIYSKYVSKGSYLVVFDTIIDDLPNNLNINRPWSKNNSPKSAVKQFLKEITKNKPQDIKGNLIKFEINKSVQDKHQISVAPDGFLLRK